MSAPTGCSLVSFDATCDYGTWSPSLPLQDGDFSKSPVKIDVQNVNGQIDSNAFSGLTNADSGSTANGPEIALLCGGSNPQYTLALLNDSLTSNLNWVQTVTISDCYNMDFQDGAFVFMTGLTLLSITTGSFSSLSGSAFTGMTNLQMLYLSVTMPSTGVPAGLFAGLTTLTTIDMSTVTLYSLPSGLFDDLKNLDTLNLQNTGLTTLPQNLFYPLLSLTTLNLGQNSWLCDCSIVWLELYLTSFGLTTTTCGSPANLAGYDLQRSIRSLNCSTTTTTVATTVSDDKWKPYVYALIGGASLALIVATAAMLCWCRYCHKLHKLTKSRGNIKGDQAGSWYLSPETRPSSKPPAYVGIQEELSNGESSPKMFRQVRVSPRKDTPVIYRAQVT